MRQPALRTTEGREAADGGTITGAVVETSGGIIQKIDSKQRSSSSFQDISSIEEPLQRQQSIVPIVTVSGSSPTPPSSPGLIIPETTSSITQSSSDRIVAATTTAATSLLSIPGTSIDLIEVGRSHSSTPLVKQLSESQISTMSPSPPVPLIRRQLSEGQANQVSSIQQATKLLYPGMKPGDLFQLVPTHDITMDEEGRSREGTYYIDSSSVLQIIPKSEPGSSSSSSIRRPSQSREMEIIRRDTKKEVEASTNFESNVSMDESVEITDVPSTSSSTTVQRSNHCPVLRPGPALGCNYCWNSIDKCGRILRRKTKYHCPECHINLCIVPCFQEYHEKSDKKKVKRNILPKPSSM